jgi:hypothetical protein
VKRGVEEDGARFAEAQYSKPCDCQRQGFHQRLAYRLAARVDLIVVLAVGALDARKRARDRRGPRRYGAPLVASILWWAEPPRAFTLSTTWISIVFADGILAGLG